MQSKHHKYKNFGLDRVGGRVFSMSLTTADGYDKWDMGGQWVAR